MIEATDDPSGPPGCSEPMKPYVKDLEVQVLRDCGHWTGHEKPDELCDLMIPWLKRKFG
jgi:pimeloyl-ACP methyl ester carboxylesterase